jgi:hypothetical protein
LEGSNPTPVVGDGKEDSRSTTPIVGEVLTDAMVEEEKRLKEGGSREGSEDGDQRGEVRAVVTVSEVGLAWAD